MFFQDFVLWGLEASLTESQEACIAPTASLASGSLILASLEMGSIQQTFPECFKSHLKSPLSLLNRIQ